MRMIRILSMYVATMIVLLHSFIPHQHHSDFKIQDHIEEHQTIDSFVDYLALAFHFEQHDGQLEKFDIGSETTADCSISASFVLSNPLLFNTDVCNVSEVYLQNENVRLDLLLQGIELRGPPAIS